MGWHEQVREPVMSDYAAKVMQSLTRNEPMCGNRAIFLVCGEVVIPLNPFLGVRPAQCGEAELCCFNLKHPDRDRYLCRQCAEERGLILSERTGSTHAGRPLSSRINDAGQNVIGTTVDVPAQGANRFAARRRLSRHFEKEKL